MFRLMSLATLLFALGQGIPAGLIRPEYTAPQRPFTIAGNLHFVGTKGLGVYLITSTAGHILIDSGLDETARQVVGNIRALGFRPEDVKILLNTHAHFDHMAGHAVIVGATGAAVYAMDGDADVMESGGATDFLWAGKVSFPPVKVARVLGDGDTVALGGNVLTAHRLGGHTKGNTAWTFTTTVGGRRFRVLIAPSLSVNPGTGITVKPSYPGIGDDYERGFAWLKRQRPDIFLAPHTGFFDFDRKVTALAARPVENPFVDRDGLQPFVAEWEAAYRKYVAAEKVSPSAVPSPKRP